MNKNSKSSLSLHLMILPATVILFIYSYIPMLGLVIAFQNYTPALGFIKSKFVGWQNFVILFTNPAFGHILYNTVFISLLKIISGLIVPILFALLMNEIRVSIVKRTIQTVISLPFFISWVLMVSIIVDILSPTGGMLNQFIEMLGFKPVFFLGDSASFPYVMMITNIWKEFGWGTIIYMATLSGIDPNLYEAAMIDGAGRWKQTLHITLPGITTTVIILATLSIGNVLNAGFEQIFMLMSPLTMETGDIIDTMVYRMGIQNGQFGIATAAGFFKSAISCIFIVTSYKLADKFAGYKII